MSLKKWVLKIDGTAPGKPHCRFCQAPNVWNILCYTWQSQPCWVSQKILPLQVGKATYKYTVQVLKQFLQSRNKIQSNSFEVKDGFLDHFQLGEINLEEHSFWK